MNSLVDHILVIQIEVLLIVVAVALTAVGALLHYDGSSRVVFGPAFLAWSAVAGFGLFMLMVVLYRFVSWQFTQPPGSTPWQ